MKIDERRLALIAEARSWIDTPFRHQASLKGVGCDCVGLIRGVSIAAGAINITPEQWRLVANYGRQPHPVRMGAAIRRFLVPIERKDAIVGDIFWMEWRDDLPMHLAFLSELDGRRTLIHALGDIGKVSEHGLTPEWEDRISSCWRLPSLEDHPG